MKLSISKEEFGNLKSRAKVKLECLWCKQEYFLTKHSIQDFLRRGNELSGCFCSRDCMYKHKIETTHKKVQCKYCQTSLIRPPHEIKDSENYFCNSSCSAKYYNQFRTKEIVRLICPICNIAFNRPKYDLHKESKSFFCSKKCAGISKRNDKTKNLFIDENGNQLDSIHKLDKPYPCDNCKTICLTSEYRLRTSKHHFCNRSCQAIFANKTYNRAGRFGINKSRAETELVTIIKKDFPNLLILENHRKLIPGGLEIDIYIPDKQIAIELNGPCHYIPIFGSNELEKTKNKDLLKIKFLQEENIKFFVINIMGAKKNLNNILINSYNEQIKPLLSDGPA